MFSLFVWRCGRAAIAMDVPEGALVVATGSSCELFDAVWGKFRLHQTEAYCEVPAIADAADGPAALDALVEFRNQIQAELAASREGRK